MEIAGELVPFPFLTTRIESNYRACTIPYRFPSDNPKKPTPTELSWIDLFLSSIPSFRIRAESDDTVPDAPVRAEKFAQRYAETPRVTEGPRIALCATSDSLTNFVNKSFVNWDSGISLKRLSGYGSHGEKVVVAANDLPSINDVTYTELIEIVAKLRDDDGKLVGVDASNLLIANSGNDLPVIDLTRISQELAYLASDADLVILEGMGRGIETNLYAQFKRDSLKIGMAKHPKVAQFLGGRLYDCIFKFNEVWS